MQNELQYLRAQPAPDPVSPALKEELHSIQLEKVELEAKLAILE